MARRSSHSHRTGRPSSTPAKRKGIPLTPLAQRMLHDLQLAGLSERTQESYLRAVRKFAQWLKKSPDQASENDLRRYLLFIKNDQQWEGNSLKVAYSGIKFFYGHTWRAALAHAHQAPRPQAAQVAYRVDDSRSRSTHGRHPQAGSEVLLLDRLFPGAALAGGAASAGFRHRRRADVGACPPGQRAQGSPHPPHGQDTAPAPPPLGHPSPSPMALPLRRAQSPTGVYGPAPHGHHHRPGLHQKSGGRTGLRDSKGTGAYIDAAGEAG